MMASIYQSICLVAHLSAPFEYSNFSCLPSVNPPPLSKGFCFILPSILLYTLILTCQFVWSFFISLSKSASLSYCSKEKRSFNQYALLNVCYSVLFAHSFVLNLSPHITKASNTSLYLRGPTAVLRFSNSLSILSILTTRFPSSSSSS